MAYFRCFVCEAPQIVDDNWRAVRLDRYGRLQISAAIPAADIRHYRADDTELVCGQTHALVLAERFLHSASLDPVQTATTNSQTGTHQEVQL